MDEIESMRRCSLHELTDEQKGFVPGSFGCHEALHVSSIMIDRVAEDLMEHPAIVINEEWYRLAAEAHQKLFDLYQAIGRDHLGAPHVP